MRTSALAIAAALSAVAATALAHGPQIQTTLDGGKIVTREIVPDTAYSTALSAPKSVYAMPLAQFAGVWRAQPDGSTTAGEPNFVGWPGFAYGFGYDAATNPEPFTAGSLFSLAFNAGLKKWDGAAFVDAGATEAEIYRGSSVAPSALARSSDAAPFQQVSFPPTGVSFAAEGADVHNTVNYRMLGNGSSTTSPLDDGIYLLSLQLDNTRTDPSDPFYFVLTKGPVDEVPEAIAALGFDASRVQVLVPEPATTALFAAGLAAAAAYYRRSARR